MRMRPFRLWLYSLVVRLLPETRAFGFKSMFLRWAGAKLGENVRINSSARFLGNGELEIGDDVWVGAETMIYSVAPAKIRLGAHIDIAPRVTIVTGTHEITPSQTHIGGNGAAKSVSIGDGCWVCAAATILPGSSIGNKSIIAAGSVVCEGEYVDQSLIAGVPAKQVKRYVD